MHPSPSHYSSPSTLPLLSRFDYVTKSNWLNSLCSINTNHWIAGLSVAFLDKAVLMKGGQLRAWIAKTEYRRGQVRNEEILTSDTKTPMTLNSFQPSLKLVELRETTVDTQSACHSFIPDVSKSTTTQWHVLLVWSFFTCEHVYKQSILHLNQHCHFTNIIFININKHKYWLLGGQYMQYNHMTDPPQMFVYV